MMEWSIVLAFAGFLLFLRFVVLAVYRLYFHPLAGFPGPKLAAITFFYEFFFDCCVRAGGQYSFQIDKLHERYGEASM